MAFPFVLLLRAPILSGVVNERSLSTLRGLSAVITGAGGGIGRGTALALSEAGASVVVSDIDADAARSVAAEIEAFGGNAVGVGTDVSDAGSVDALARIAIDTFGSVQVLHNNAGVAPSLAIDSMSRDDWRWVLAVNLEGVINGILSFLPHFKAQDGLRHIVNTASMSGFLPPPNFGAYNATKSAVVALSETMRTELAIYGIGVSVLCPGLVSTNIVENTARHRPSRNGAPTDNVSTAELRAMSPEEVGRLVRTGIEKNERYIFTHPEYAPMVKARFDRILGAFGQ